jgi:hypothetical protein
VYPLRSCAGGNTQFTSPANSYSFRSVLDVTGADSVVFTVRGMRDATILLSDDRTGSEPWEIVIGGWYQPNGNARSMVRRGMQGHNPAAWPVTDNILSPFEDRFFWLQWSKDTITLGKVCNADVYPFQTCCLDAFLVCVNYTVSRAHCMHLGQSAPALCGGVRG